MTIYICRHSISHNYSTLVISQPLLCLDLLPNFTYHN